MHNLLKYILDCYNWVGALTCTPIIVGNLLIICLVLFEAILTYTTKWPYIAHFISFFLGTTVIFTLFQLASDMLVVFNLNVVRQRKQFSIVMGFIVAGLAIYCLIHVWSEYHNPLTNGFFSWKALPYLRTNQAIFTLFIFATFLHFPQRNFNLVRIITSVEEEEGGKILNYYPLVKKIRRNSYFTKKLE